MLPLRRGKPKLLFGGKLRTKLPMLLPEVGDIGLCGNDAVHKAKRTCKPIKREMLLNQILK